MDVRSCAGPVALGEEDRLLVRVDGDGGTTLKRGYVLVIVVVLHRSSTWR